MIQATGLTVERGSTLALDSVDLSIGAGVTVLLGPNGAGKSTFIETALGSVRRTGGRLSVLGYDPADGVRALRAAVGWLPQEPRLAGSLNAIDLVTYAAWLKGLRWPNAHALASEALEFVGLSDSARTRTSALSGGQRRRVAMASAIVHRPAVVFLDEPMNGLDPEQRRSLRGFIQHYAAESCVIVSTHILQDVPALGGRVVILAEGKVRHAGPTDDFVASARTSTMTDLEEVYLQLIGGRSA